jgi:hypothetical protein
MVFTDVGCSGLNYDVHFNIPDIDPNLPNPFLLENPSPDSK